MRGGRGFGTVLWAVFVLVAVVSGWAAVQMVGAAIAPASVPVLSSGDVKQRLATSTPAARERSPSAKPSTATTRPATSSNPPSPTDDPTKDPTKDADKPVVRTLVSRGGSVVAECTGTTAYLRSASPAVGYRLDEEEWKRGPDQETEVRFVSASTEVTMKVTCPGGVPTADVESDSESGEDD